MKLDIAGLPEVKAAFARAEDALRDQHGVAEGLRDQLMAAQVSHAFTRLTLIVIMVALWALSAVMWWAALFLILAQFGGLLINLARFSRYRSELPDPVAALQREADPTRTP